MSEEISEKDLPYRSEYAKSGRSSCKACKESIGKAQLRLAVMVQVKWKSGQIYLEGEAGLQVLGGDYKVPYYATLNIVYCSYSHQCLMVKYQTGSIRNVSSHEIVQKL